MTINIEESVRNGTTLYFTAGCDAARAFVAVHDDGSVRVCSLNAAHRVWRGPGRQFQSVPEALAAYKSGAMKAIIQAAADAGGQPSTAERAVPLPEDRPQRALVR